MRFAAVKAVAHNIADSFGSGVGLPIGIYSVDVHAEVSATPDKCAAVDFLTGNVSPESLSNAFYGAAQAYSGWLPILAAKHGVSTDQIARLVARYEVDERGEMSFHVEVADRSGKRFRQKYVWPMGESAD